MTEGNENNKNRKRGRPRKIAGSAVRVQFIIDERTLREFDSKWQADGFRERAEAIRHLIINYIKGRI